MGKETLKQLIERAKSGDKKAHCDAIMAYTSMYNNMIALQESGLIEPNDAHDDWSGKAISAANGVFLDAKDNLDISEDTDIEDVVTISLCDLQNQIETAFFKGVEWGAENPEPPKNSKYHLVK